ncbi:MAG: glycosyltransferase family 2 protein [Lachnospiraceae bacterium]|nr:glycosyltransferase family 2 protein [Lachnospiraceae bacterium]
MAKKILTIAVCAYNMEEYLEQALESCLIEEHDKLEVLIMNDGSTDRTEEIAKKYCNEYPDTFVLINKENGGWGSNLNEAVKLAKGKYFKEMDADDWFETYNLQKLVNILETQDIEVVLTNHRYCYPDRVVDNVPKWSKYRGSDMNLNDADCFYFPIWDAAFLTNIVREHYKNLPKHTLYTDNLFILYLLPYIKTVKFVDFVVYNYRLGRDGQSVNISSLKKHYKELVYVLKLAFDFCEKLDKEKMNKHVNEKLTSTYVIFAGYLLKVGDMKDAEIKKYFVKLEKKLKRDFNEIYKQTNKRKKLFLLRITNYAAFGFVVKFIKKTGKGI